MAQQQASFTPKTKLIRGRACRNCTGDIPKSTNPANTKKRAFCCENCRKEFHKNNGISVHRLKVQVRQWVAEEVDSLMKAISEDTRRALLEGLEPKPTSHPKVRNGRDRSERGLPQ